MPRAVGVFIRAPAVSFIVRITTGTIGSLGVIKNPGRRLTRAIIESLTFENPQFSQVERYSRFGSQYTNIPAFIYLAQKVGNTVVFPRGFGTYSLPRNFRKQFDQIKFKDSTVNRPVDFPDYAIKLSRDQLDILDAFKRAACNKDRFGTYFVVAPTASGKTIAQAAMAKFTGQKTLILCLTDLIMQTWYNDLSLAFGLKFSEIGLIKQKSYKIGKVFTLASIATLGRRKLLWNQIYDTFGTVIMDEVHTVKGPKLFEFVKECPAKYILGATATENNDKYTNFWLYSLFGQPIKVIDVPLGNTKSSMALQNSRIITTNFKYSYQSDNLDFNHLLDAMVDDDLRNDLISHHVYMDWKRGRSLLIVTRRVFHAKLLQDILTDRGITDCNLLTGETNTDKAYTRNLIDLVVKRKIRCVVATQQAVKLGANLNGLDTLYTVTPIASKTDVEQLIGRIRRRSPGKTVCELVSVLDLNVNYLMGLHRRVSVPVILKMRGRNESK